MSDKTVWEDLRDLVDTRVRKAADGDPRLERYLRRQLENWAVNQGSGRIYSIKQRLKKKMFADQKGLCGECGVPLDERHFELDRLNAAYADEEDQGYREGNVRAVHPPCNPRGPHPAGRKPAAS